MEAPNSLHPDHQLLLQYGLGKLDDEWTSLVHEHLQVCQECHQRVAEIKSDSLLGDFRDVSDTSARSSQGSSLNASSFGSKQSKAVGSLSTDSLPPGLADHPDYQVKRELGRGGMGVVYLAHNTMMDRDEVLKVMGRQLLEDPGDLERFQREIRAVAKLHHPNIVTAYTAFRIECGLVFAMEYVEGLDLSKLVTVKGPLPVVHATYFIHQAALGLQHAHEKGMVHRDIKPHNLILTHDGESRVVKVLDFGLAKVTRGQKPGDVMTAEGQALGTPDYIAPEQIKNALDADIRSDLYSLGCTLFFLLTGRPPFQGSLYDLFQAHISRDAEPLNLIRPEVSSELAALVAKMMAKEPGERFQTPGEVAQALKPFFKKANKESKSPLPETFPRSRPPSVWAAVTVGVLMLGMLGAWIGGVFKVRTQEGTIILENLPSGSETLVDGKTVTVTPAEGGEPLQITSEPGDHKLGAPTGKHRLVVRRGDVVLKSQEVTITTSGQEPIRIRLEEPRIAKGLDILSLGPLGGTTGSSTSLRTEANRDTTRNAGIPLAAKDKIPGTPELPESATRSADVKTEGLANRAIGKETGTESGNSSNPTPALPLRNLVAFYGFDDGKPLDLSGHGKNGVFGGVAPTLVSVDGNNLALKFDDAKGDSKLIIPVNINPDTMTQITMGGWFKAIRNDREGWLLTNDDGGGFDRTLRISNLDQRSSAFQWSTHTGKEVLGGKPVKAGVWTFASMRHDQATGKMILDVDDTRFPREKVYFGTGTARTFIGNHPKWRNMAFQGSVDNVFIYDTVLTDAQIDEIRTRGRSMQKWFQEPLNRLNSATDSTVAKPQIALTAPERIPPVGTARRAGKVVFGGWWTVEDDQLILIKAGPKGSRVQFGDEDWRDYDLTFEARKDANPNCFGAFFRHSETQGYFLNLESGNRKVLGFWPGGGNQWQYRSNSSPDIRPLRWYKLKISSRGPHIRIELNGQLLFDRTDNLRLKGNVSLHSENAFGRFRNIKVTAPDGTILWEGPPDLPPN